LGPIGKTWNIPKGLQRRLMTDIFLYVTFEKTNKQTDKQTNKQQNSSLHGGLKFSKTVSLSAGRS